MKRLIAILSLLLLPISVLATDTPAFNATDKVLYFSTDVLIDVIKRTFPEDLQLNVAQTYVDLINENGNVSVYDLMQVCKAGNLDNIQCRNFIQDLLNTSGSGDIKPFYWADYIGKGRVLRGIRNSGDGYFNDHKSLDLGEWKIQFDWTTSSTAFKHAYPQSNAIAGTSACTSDKGVEFVADNTKNYTLNEQSGEYCWCRMTGPEESQWVYLYDQKEYNHRFGTNTICARDCSASCLNAMYGDTTLYSTNVQKAMFTNVKLNGSNKKTVIDDTLADELINEFKPCEFDWSQYAKVKLPSTYYVSATDYVPSKQNQGILKNSALKKGEWMIQPEWVKSKEFQCKYPGVEYIKGISKCIYTVKPNGYCRCKLTSPESSEWWVPFDDPEIVFVRCDEDCVHLCRDYKVSSNGFSRAIKSIGKK